MKQFYLLPLCWGYFLQNDWWLLSLFFLVRACVCDRLAVVVDSLPLFEEHAPHVHWVDTKRKRIVCYELNILKRQLVMMMIIIKRFSTLFYWISIINSDDHFIGYLLFKSQSDRMQEILRSRKPPNRMHNIKSIEYYHSIYRFFPVAESHRRILSIQIETPRIEKWNKKRNSNLICLISVDSCNVRCAGRRYKNLFYFILNDP